MLDSCNVTLLQRHILSFLVLRGDIARLQRCTAIMTVSVLVGSIYDKQY